MALLGAASITGVPAFGFPKIRSLLGGIFNPAFAAVIDQGEQCDSFFLKDCFQLRNRLVHRVITR